MIAKAIYNSSSCATVTGGGFVGGLVGYSARGTITDSYSYGAVTGGGGAVGGLVGYSARGTITDSYSYATVTGGDAAGGLVGFLDGGTITDSYSYATVTGGDFVGGLVGLSSVGTITDSYSYATVTGGDSVGGLVGHSDGGTITNSFSHGAVTGDTHVGGLVGNLWGGTITDSYSHGAVTGGNDVGGLVGTLDYEFFELAGNIYRSYSAGSVSGTDASTTGGLVGILVHGTVQNSYWNTQNSGQATSAAGIGKTTAQMLSGFPSTDIYTGWSTAVWVFAPSVRYPQLLSNPEPDPVPDPRPGPRPTPRPTPGPRDPRPTLPLRPTLPPPVTPGPPDPGKTEDLAAKRAATIAARQKMVLGFLSDYPSPQYLLPADSIGEAISTLTQRGIAWMRKRFTGSENPMELYRLAHNAAFDYHNLAVTALIQANRALVAGNLEKADIYLGYFSHYNRLMYETTRTANDIIIIGSITTSIRVTSAIYQIAKATVTIGARFLPGPASILADTLFLATDYAIDNAMSGAGAAKTNLAKSVLIKAVMKTPTTDLGGKTLEEAVARMTKDSVGRWFNTFISSEAGQNFLLEVTAHFVEEGLEGTFDQYLDEIIFDLQNAGF